MHARIEAKEAGAPAAACPARHRPLPRGWPVAVASSPARTVLPYPAWTWRPDVAGALPASAEKAVPSRPRPLPAPDCRASRTASIPRT